MVFQTVIKFIPILLYSIIFLGIFYWQFIYVYGSLIDYFKDYKIFILYGYIYIYIFGIGIVAISLINLINRYLIKEISFVIITIGTILIFYALSFHNFYHIIEYFIKIPLSHNAIISIIFFIIFALGYALYSIFILLIKETIPLWHILIFSIFGAIYTIIFIYHFDMFI